MIKKYMVTFLLGLFVSTFSVGAEATWKIEAVRLGNSEDEIYGVAPQIENKDKSEVISNLNDTLQINVVYRLEAAKRAVEPAKLEKTQFQTQYEIPYNTDRYISVVQQYYVFTGGAHGNTTYDIGTYDLRDGSILTLKDIFGPKVNYSKVLTRIVRKQIKEQGKSDRYIYFKEVDPEVQFYLTSEGLVLLYPPYGIAPYVEGTIRFMIPWSEIRDKMNPDFHLE